MNEVDIKKVVSTIVWYDGQDAWIKNLVKEIKESSPDYLFRIDLEQIREGQKRTIWEILVQLYGNWKIDIAHGWIAEKEECVAFLEEIIESLKERPRENEDLHSNAK